MAECAVRAGYLLPHPPIIVPGVGQGREAAARKTIEAMQGVGKELDTLRPDTVVLVSPHAPMFSDYVFIYDAPTLAGDLGQFGSDAGVSFAQDGALTDALEREMRKAGVPGGRLDKAALRRMGISGALDHGAVVPLYFAGSFYKDFRLVVLSCSALDMQAVYSLGQAIQRAAEAEGRSVAVIASGDLSHKVNDESPYGAVPEGKRFDAELMDALKAGDIPRVLSIDHALREAAAECGYRPVVVLCGALDGYRADVRVLSYEAPFGIGYGIAAFTPREPYGEPCGALKAARALAAKKKAGSPQADIAKRTMEMYVRERRTPAPEDFPEYHGEDALYGQRAGVFVSLKKFGELRGCIGTTGPTTGSVMEEIIRNAISAGTGDPRFEPVTADELEYLDYSVDVLGAPEPAQRSDLDHRRYGVIVEQGRRRGLLLPDLEGVDSVEEQLSIACKKAGIDPNGKYDIYRFTVTRYT